MHDGANAGICDGLLFCREEVVTEKVTSFRLSTEKRSSFEDNSPRFEDKASELQHSKALLSPTRRQRSRTEAILKEEHGSTQTRSNMENTPSSRVSSCTWTHVARFSIEIKTVLPSRRNLWFSGCRSRTASAPSVTSWRGFSQGRALLRPRAEAPRQPCLSSASPWWI